jgi:hypothetical protein
MNAKAAQAILIGEMIPHRAGRSPMALEAVIGEPLPRLHPLLGIVLWGLAGAIVAGWLGLAAFHINDDYHVTHTQGVWIAAAEAARARHLYPPLFDGEHYAGTRYMPLSILLNALASSATGDPLIGGKLLAAILMAALLTLIVVLLRQFLCPWPLAAALAAMVVATDAGLQAGTTIGGDVLPVLLQVGVLAMAHTGRTRRSIVVAGALAGLAFASKLTGLWGALAVLTWLAAQRQWKSVATFAAACVSTAAVILGTVQVISAGGLSKHLMTFSVAGVQGTLSLLRAPNQVLYNLRGFATGAVVLLPLAALGALVTGSWRRLPVVHFALAYSLVVLLVVYTDLGTGSNQLLDVIVLTALAAGYLAGGAVRDTDRRYGQVVLLAVATSVIWAAGIDLIRTVGFDVRRAISAGKPTTRAAEVIARMVRPGEQVLVEDPAIDVAMGRRPLIMDPFMVRRLDRADPRLVDPLIGWIRARRFDLVVLIVPLENPEFDYWWSDYHFGPRVANALRAAYRQERWVGRYLLYRPVR